MSDLKSTIETTILKNVENITFQCNICCDNFDASEKCILDCNDQHYFCKNCINDWYKETCTKGFTNELYSCPICKKYGGYKVLQKSKDKYTYDKFIENMNERCKTHCLCRNDDINSPYTEAKFCRINLTIMNQFYYGGTVTFGDNTQIGMCKDHYQQFDSGEQLYHFFHGLIFKDEDEEEDKEENITTFDWIRKELMTINKYKKCDAQTKLGHRCTRKYICYYKHKNNGKSLFVCSTHEKQLLKNNDLDTYNKY
jgi:hypothetical protein